MYQNIRHLNAHESEVVEVQWLLEDGTRHFERYTVPPPEVRARRNAALTEALTGEQPTVKRNAAGQVTDYLQENAAGQKFGMAPPPPSPRSLDVVGTSGGKVTTEVVLPSLVHKSAQSCGCDEAAGWVREVHREKARQEP